MKVSYIYLHCRRRSHEQPHEHQTSMDDGGQEGGQGGRRSGVFPYEVYGCGGVSRFDPRANFTN